MSLLRVALRLIVGVNICVHHASRWTRMVWGGLPRIVQQFHLAQFLENDTTPVLRRPDRPQSALAFAAILVAEHTRLAHAIAAQPVRAKQPREIFIDGADRSLIRYRRPNQPVHVFHRLDLCLDDTHPSFTIPLVALSLCPSTIYNTVALESWCGRRARGAVSGLSPYIWQGTLHDAWVSSDRHVKCL